MRISSGYRRVLSLLACVPICIAVIILQTGCGPETRKVLSSENGYKFVEVCDDDAGIRGLLDGSGSDGCRYFTEQAADPAPPGPNPPYYASAVRQADCSLTRLILDSNFNIQPAYTVTNYQDLLHRYSGSTTTADQFKGGCKDPPPGVASQIGEGLGPFANGNWGFAAISPDGVGVSLETPSGQNVSDVDYPAFTASSSPAASTFNVAIADLNGDGNLDLVLTSFGFSAPTPGLISIYLGNGDGTFKPAANIPVAVNALGVTIDDMNNDGKLDLVVVGQGSPGQEFLPGNGDGTFGTPIVSTDSRVQALAAVSADFNKDGNKDIALSTGQILLGDGKGNFALQPGTLSTLATGTVNGNPNTVTGIAAADFNNDGDIDLAVTNAVSSTVDMYFGKGDGTFNYEGSYASISGQQNIRALDIDGDGNADLFVGTASDGGFAADLNTQGFFLSLLNLGSGTMAVPSAYLPTQPAQQFPALFDAADFNGDQDPDIVTIGADSGNTTALLSVLKGSGKGTFTQGPQTDINIPGLAAGQATLEALVAADIDGGPNQDVVFAHTDQGGANKLSVALGNGDGTFKAQTDFSVPGAIVSLVVADVDGDGKPDFAFVANPATGVTTGTAIYVMLNTTTSPGTVTFGAPQQVGVEPNLNFVTASNLGNGKQDLIATSANLGTNATGSVFVYLGNGNGTFMPAATLNGGTFPQSVGVGDMNNDGKPDLVVAATNTGFSTGTLTLFPGKGDGTFQAGQVTQVAENPSSNIVIADPGKSGNLSVYFGSLYTFVASGNGDGTFAPSGLGTGILPLGVSSQSLKFVDVNGDGYPDMLLVSNQYAIEVLLNDALSYPTVAATNTTIAASAAAVNTGQTETFTAQVAPVTASGTPTGTVTFVDGATNLGTVALAGGQAILSTTTLAKGTPTIVAFYNGSASFGVSSSSVGVTVDSSTLTDTTTAISGPTSANTGALVTFQAQVSPASGTAIPTGTVTFLDGNTIIGTGSLSAKGITAFSTSVLPGGSQTITAEYSGDANFNPSVSTLLTITIGGAPLTATTTKLTVTPANVTAGATVSMSASVAGPSGSTGTPTGTVTFLDGKTPLGTGTLNSSGVATYSTTSLAVGTQSITAGYGGDTNFAASTSSPVVVTVTAAVPSFTVSGTAVSVAPGASTGNTSTVTVTPAGGFTGSVALTAVITGSPTGAQDTPTLSFGSTSPVTVPSSGVGTATLTITTTPASSSALAYPKRDRGRYLLGGAALACILFFGIPLRRGSWRRLGLVVWLAFLTLGVLGCGGGGGGGGGGQSNPGTTVGTYTVTVNGTSGTETTTAKITLTVQ